MDKISVMFKNCYGIRRMEAEFDFSKKSGQIIYAPNGSMKSSFAATFKDHSAEKESKDRIYDGRKAERSITDQDGNQVNSENIFVIDSLDTRYESDRVSTLLVNKNLKNKYDSILKSIEDKQNILIRKVSATSGLRKGLEEIISVTISRKSDNLLRALDRVRSEVVNDSFDSSLEGIEYSSIFTERVEKFLNDPQIKEALEDYTSAYDRLLENSRYFRKGVFNHYQAGEIAKQLKNHGFFKAEHKIYLHSDTEDTIVKTEGELEKIIHDELEKILSDDELKKKFDEIEKKLNTNELRGFREFLLNNQMLIPRLKEPEILKEELLKSYLMLHKEEYIALMDEFSRGRVELDRIAAEASNQVTEWQKIIDIFNRRFSVPFKVSIENKEDVILKRATPNIGFAFEDENSTPVSIERNALLDVLSHGEQRALYLLNIIFEIEARKNEKIPTLFVIDDIADSFDYKNKYAIVEYLSDILTEPYFHQIILTHNYDFYRTVWKRLDLSGTNFHVMKSSERIELSNEKMYKDPFDKWKSEDKTDALLAMIPFVRNLADYCGYREESEKLTSLLHQKINTSPLTLEDLFKIYKRILNNYEFKTCLKSDKPVVPLILETAEKISNTREITLDLKKKDCSFYCH